MSEFETFHFCMYIFVVKELPRRIMMYRQMVDKIGKAAS